jgi:Nickel responsive protein SCO4226-like
MHWCMPEVKEHAMPKFVIEREIAEAGKLPKQELRAISQKSCAILQSMGSRIQWVQSYVTDDKIYCIYVAPDEETVRAHAQKGGFPANSIARVRSVIDPTTAEQAA